MDYFPKEYKINHEYSIGRNTLSTYDSEDQISYRSDSDVLCFTITRIILFPKIKTLTVSKDLTKNLPMKAQRGRVLNE